MIATHRSGSAQLFFKILALRNFAILTEKDLCWSLFFIKNVWAVFMWGDFSCTKYDIQGTGIGWHHAGEQLKKIKNHGGITSKAHNENSRTGHLLASLHCLL